MKREKGGGKMERRVVQRSRKSTSQYTSAKNILQSVKAVCLWGKF